MPSQADLSPLWNDKPAGLVAPMGYLQGRILTFNKKTLENTVEVGNSVLTDVPVFGIGDATQLGAGSVVGMMVVGSTLAITGRFVRPGTSEAREAISPTSTRTYRAYEAGGFSIAAGGFLQNNPSEGTSTPFVDVDLPANARVLVMWGGKHTSTGVTPATATSEVGGAIGIDLSGANTVAPAFADPLLRFSETTTVSTGTVRHTACATDGSKFRIFEGLSAGLTRFSCQYWRPGTQASCVFLNIELLVMIL